MNIRKIKKSDLDACAELYASVFSSEPWNEQWTAQHAYERLSHFYDSKGFIGFLSETKNMTGFVLGNTEPFYFGTLFYLREMCISNDCQGKGLGSQLLEMLENELKAKQVKSIYLTTEHGIPAAKFYEKNGFECDEKMGFYAKVLKFEN